MAEILGTVVGVVSLGIQVCSGVYTYLDGIQGRKEDVDSATRLCKSMELLLMRLQGLQIRITASSAAGAATIQGAMEAAKEELSHLEKLLEQLRDIEGPFSSIGEKLKNQKARLLYPFRRDHMERLESRLRNSNEAIQSALQAVQLEVSLNTGDALSTIETAVLTSHTELAGTLSNVHLMSSQGQSSMVLISEDVSTMSSQLRTFLPQARQQMDRSLTVMSEVQQHATDSLSTLAEIRTMAEFSAAGINEMRDIFQTLRPSSPRDLCQKLVSKPEALQMACRNTDFAHHPDIVRPSAFGGFNSVATNGFKCRCHLRRSAKTTQRQFGPGFLRHQVVSNKAHRTDCVYALFNDASSTWTLGLSARAFRVAISTAISVTMSSMSGAGGLSISPSLTIFTIREDSPAMDLLYLLKRVHWHLGPADLSTLADEVVKTLHWMFTTNKASPLDTDRWGSTLIHTVANFDSGRSGCWTLPVLEYLHLAGVPIDRGDCNGWLPFHYFSGLSFSLVGDTVDSAVNDHEAERMQAARLLWPDNDDPIFDVYECPSYSQPLESINTLMITSHRQLVLSYPELTPWYGSDLFTAIINEDELLLCEVLGTGSVRADLCSINGLGLTALALLLRWPAGLEVASDILDESFWEAHDRRYNGAETGLEYAFGWSRSACQSTSTLPCSETCDCSRSTAILLESQCPILVGYNGFSDSRWMIRFDSATTRCQELVIIHLASRRRQLARLAVRYLNQQLLDELGITSETVLEYHILGAIKALNELRIAIPTSSVAQAAAEPDEYLEWGSFFMFHVVSEMKNAEWLFQKLFAAGFRDLDSVNWAGNSPSTRVTHPASFAWLVEHGADPHRQCDAEKFVPGFTATHSLFRCDDIKVEDLAAIMDRLIGAVPRLDERVGFEDCCRCACSVDGCHPYTVLWRCRLRYTSLDSLFEEHCSSSSLFRATCLRVLTFEKLSIRHTCCEYGDSHIEDDEIQELWEEDAALIELLESLVAEFEVKLDEMACQLSHFMKTYWAARMEQVEEELEEQRMTKENRDGIEELGITLRVDEDSASEDSVSEDSASEDSVHEHFESVYCSLNQPEFWLKEIAKIKEKASGK